MCSQWLLYGRSIKSILVSWFQSSMGKPPGNLDLNQHCSDIDDCDCLPVGQLRHSLETSTCRICEHTFDSDGGLRRRRTALLFGRCCGTATFSFENVVLLKPTHATNALSIRTGKKSCSQCLGVKLVRNGLARRPHFGVFLTDSEDLEPSEVAFGGADAHRMLEPVSWSKVYRPDLGYWVVPIIAVRVDGLELDVCKDGTCRGVVDTGTSHLGVPGPFDKELGAMLKVDAGDLLDCRLAKSPKVEIELEGKTIELHASSYMRRLPLREGVSVSSEKGVTMDDKDKKHTGKEATFERPGYARLLVGPSKDNMKCIRPKDPVQCDPEAANWRDDIYADKFHIHLRGEELCVNRTDEDGGWGMDLKFYCPEPWAAEKEGKAEAGMENIYLGELDFNEERCYDTFAEVDCPISREFVFRKAEHKKLCVTRKGLQVAKASDVIKCKVIVDHSLIGLEEVVIGPHRDGETTKCVTPSTPVTCDKDAGNRRKEPGGFKGRGLNPRMEHIAGAHATLHKPTRKKPGHAFCAAKPLEEPLAQNALTARLGALCVDI
eukprot:symbB.v1.2.006988.t1/scaffold426.1/size206518/3